MPTARQRPWIKDHGSIAIGGLTQTQRMLSQGEVGSALYQKTLDGDIRAMQFYLKTQAGWSEKNSIELSTPQNNAWTIEIVKPKDISN